MKLRRNQRCPIHKSLFCCGRESLLHKPRQIRPGVQRIEDTHHPRGYRELRSRTEMRKLLNRKIVEQAGNAPSARKSSLITTTSCPTIEIPREWEEHGETTIQTISKQCIGGATRRKGHAALTTDGSQSFGTPHSSILTSQMTSHIIVA